MQEIEYRFRGEAMIFQDYKIRANYIGTGKHKMVKNHTVYFKSENLFTGGLADCKKVVDDHYHANS